MFYIGGVKNYSDSNWNFATVNFYYNAAKNFKVLIYVLHSYIV